EPSEWTRTFRLSTLTVQLSSSCTVCACWLRAGAADSRQRPAASARRTAAEIRSVTLRPLCQVREKRGIDESGQRLQTRHAVDALSADDDRGAAAHAAPAGVLDVGLHARRIAVIAQRVGERGLVEADAAGERDEV